MKHANAAVQRLQTCFATPRSPAQSDATALLAQRRTDRTCVPPHPHFLSAFGLTPCLSQLPQPQSPECWWTPQKIWSGSLNPSLLGAFGLTSKLAGQVQNLAAERANNLLY
ncbi:MAG: hypothetical protein NW224_29200 [Leptolyngbyaceae cyanobacterium bins.302]|nr:hypothetical protein [Leptolyngbyaceae cyanobacterium bins.302]